MVSDIVLRMHKMDKEDRWVFLTNPPQVLYRKYILVSNYLTTTSIWRNASGLGPRGR